MSNKKKIDRIITHWKHLLETIGEDNNREGIMETPQRIGKMYMELFKGYDIDNLPTVTTFNNGNDGIHYDSMICDTGEFYSHCEHHVVPFYGNYFFAVIPHKQGKLLGLSKVARVVDFFSSRLQIQERLTHQIVDYIYKELCKGTNHKPLGIALILEAEHLCKTMRGVKKKGKMRTAYLLGCFKEDENLDKNF